MIWTLAFAGGLAVATGFARRFGTLADSRTACLLTANFGAVLLGHLITGEAAPWGWFIAVDAATAFMVLRPPASRVQAVIGAIYILQLLIHIAFASAGSADQTRLYLDLLAAGGWCQLLILATGAIHHGRRRKAIAARYSGGGVAGFGAARVERLDEWPRP